MEESGLHKKKRSEFKTVIPDGMDYFFDQIQVIAKNDYQPSVQDMIKTRIKTTGFNDKVFNIENYKYHIYDCGGQRNERKKWLDRLQKATALIFVVSLSEFDQMCFEDSSTPRMAESLKLWETILGARYFLDSKFFLVFNKKDLFQEKLKEKDITVFFKNYKGKNEFEPSIDFIEKEFKDMNTEPDRKVITKVICATDTNNIKNTFDEIRKHILDNPPPKKIVKILL